MSRGFSFLLWYWQEIIAEQKLILEQRVQSNINIVASKRNGMWKNSNQEELADMLYHPGPLTKNCFGD